MSLDDAAKTIDETDTLDGLQAIEKAILARTRTHEEALTRLRTRYGRVRKKLYDKFKKETMRRDNSALGSYQTGCAKLRKGASKAELNAQAKCLQAASELVDDSALGRLVLRHLFEPPARPPTCEAFRQVSVDQLSSAERACLAATGDARWVETGLVDAPSNASASKPAGGCARSWLGAGETRCLLQGKDLLFLGNSVVRRQLYTLLDLLAGPNAHRTLTNFTEVHLPSFHDEGLIRRSFIWDQDQPEVGYHAAQLFTIDLQTGEHRFHVPHRDDICGVGDTYSTFNMGRMEQWRNPKLRIDRGFRSSKWAGREWKPLVSFRVDFDDLIGKARPTAADRCTAPEVSWAGAYAGAVNSGPPRPPTAAAEGTHKKRRKGGATPATLSARIRAKLFRDVEAHFANGGGCDNVEGGGGPPCGGDVREWIGNVSIHVEVPRTTGTTLLNRPNVWVYFPTYHGERERFNGFCEDKVCECTGELAKCHRHPECRGRHVCKPWPVRSAGFADAALAYAASLSKRDRLLGQNLRLVQVSPFYDDCWPGRGRCQGMRPCPEPPDAHWSCRATAMFCPAAVGRGGWPSKLRELKSWIPSGHPSASMLYLYEGQTNENLDETFRTWSENTVGYGAHAVIFGPQFGSFYDEVGWSETFQGIRTALDRSDDCLGRRTLVLFRSPAFNFDPVNSQEQQNEFGALMRPLVERAGFVYLDMYTATHEAVFQTTPRAIKFAKNSAFHYLNNGRYLMAQLLLHALRQHVPSVVPGPSLLG